MHLKEIRKKSGVTLKELGDAIGVAESTVSQYENGKRSPDFETLLKIAEYFNVSTDFLLTGEKQEKKELTLTDEDERDVIKKADAILAGLDGDGLMLDGDIASPEALEVLRTSIENGIRYAKLVNKEKQNKS